MGSAIAMTTTAGPFYYIQALEVLARMRMRMRDQAPAPIQDALWYGQDTPCLQRKAGLNILTLQYANRHEKSNMVHTPAFRVHESSICRQEEG